ncbi:sterol desaturase family protein [Thiofilum flexile]|uniref:sterol desaturase family protein n=1 Tax=Thiofilum flexile TaxID=125627 RepID=UPI000374FE06|nr:sterol desaturase family protein [Thiofilum flexile]
MEMQNLQPLQLIIPSVFLALLVLEVIIARRKRQDVFIVKDCLSNIGMMLFSNTVLKVFTVAWTVWLISLIQPLQLFSLEKDLLTFTLAFVVTDFMYYWYHRLSHESPLLWSMHHTHHSSLAMNFTTAVRLNWVGKFISPLFFLPLIIIGFPVEYVFGSLVLGLLYQLFLHTEFLPRMGWFEGKLLNTPSAHRVHHGVNPLYIDKNYAAVFIVWDRMFGSYQAETEKVQYGTTDGFIGYNPLSIQFGAMIRYGKRRLARLNGSTQSA